MQPLIFLAHLPTEQENRLMPLRHLQSNPLLVMPNYYSFLQPYSF